MQMHFSQPIWKKAVARVINSYIIASYNSTNLKPSHLALLEPLFATLSALILPFQIKNYDATNSSPCRVSLKNSARNFFLKKRRLSSNPQAHPGSSFVTQMMSRSNGPRKPGTGVERWVDIVGCWCAVGYGILAFLARQPGEPGLPLFFLLVAWTGLPVFGLYLYISRSGERFPLGRMFFWAAVFRVCGLVGGPLFEDDFYRYLWDGYRFATTGTPYGVAPEAFFIDPMVPAAFHAVLDRINNPELSTIYAPTTQFVFLFGYWLYPGSVTALQSILIVADLATVALLLRLAPVRNVMLYAWCPLVIKEIAFTAHPDGIGICLLLAAIVLARNRRWPKHCYLLRSGCRGQSVCPGAGTADTSPRPNQVLGSVRSHGFGTVRAVSTERGHGYGVVSGFRTGVGVQFGAVRSSHKRLRSI